MRETAEGNQHEKSNNHQRQEDRISAAIAEAGASDSEEMKKMARTEIEYTVGMARDGTGAVYYMLGEVETEDGAIVLYAETPASDSYETAYKALRMEILEQAAEEGIDGNSLVFCYD